MHSALLIDEILQHILELCEDSHMREYRATLCHVARCCKAWKDPALDKLWSHLHSVTPLLRLLPKECVQVGPLVYIRHVPGADLTAFSTYAARVKHITHLQAIRVFSAMQPCLVLPRLTSVQFYYDGCDTASGWSVCRTIRNVDITSGLYSRRGIKGTEDRSSALAAYLDNLRTHGACLDTLRIRGSILTERLSQALPSFQTLKTLVLYTGDTLSAHGLAAIFTLPSLLEMDVHASHIDAVEFTEACASHSGWPLLPSLKRLSIRADAALLATLFQLLPRGVLRTLHADVTSLSGHASLRSAFESLSVCAAQSLEELTIDDFTSGEDAEDSGAVFASECWFPLSLLRPLSALQCLRRFTVTALVPPDLSDDDLAQLCGWWPQLEALDLGALECPEELPSRWRPRLTAKALIALARLCPRVKRAALPTDLSQMPLPLPQPPAAQRLAAAASLHTLRVGLLPQDPASASAFVKFALALFPSLVELESAALGTALSVGCGALIDG